MHRAERRVEASGHVLQNFSWVGHLWGAGVVEPEVGGPRKGGRRQRLVCLDTVWCGAGGLLRRSKENPKPTWAGVSGLTDAASETSNQQLTHLVHPKSVYVVDLPHFCSCLAMKPMD